MKWVGRALVAMLALVLFGALWAMRHGEIQSIAESAPPGPQAVERGELLAKSGGCASCHGEDLAGGQAIETPFGAVHSTNITPDPETGLGLWSEAAFRRAMRTGVDREGRHLYPAFPYDNFTNATDTDLGDIFAYLRSVPAVSRRPKTNDLAFPFNQRLLLEGWKTLFLEEGPYRPDPSHDEVWNRGAYLAEGLTHCSACHTPRNALGARDTSRAYAGGMADGWWSPALDFSSTAPMQWTENELVNYLYDGWEENHGIAAGPMKHVVENVSVLPEDDVAAIAVYIASLAPPPDGTDRNSGRLFSEAVQIVQGETPDVNADLASGAALFVDKCANCHREGTESVPLALSTAVSGPQPENFLRIVREGTTPTESAYFVRPMRAFTELSAGEAADLARFVRNRFAEARQWRDIQSVAERIWSEEPAAFSD